MERVLHRTFNEDLRQAKRLQRQPGFLEQYANRAIFVFDGEVVGSYRKEDLLAEHGDEPKVSLDAIRLDLLVKGIDINECVQLLTEPVMTVEVGF